MTDSNTIEHENETPKEASADRAGDLQTKKPRKTRPKNGRKWEKTRAIKPDLMPKRL